MSEPTSALTFGDLLKEVARAMGVGYYGASGNEVLQVPTNVHDLDECKRHVNNAIRMFIADAPRTGWRWTRPVAQVTVWPSVAKDADVTVTGGAFASGETTLTASEDAFYPTMELKTISITGVGDFAISSYVSATQVKVTGDASTASGATFSIEANGNYTLPQTFGGMYTGKLTYTAGSNTGSSLDWTDESVIRQWRADITNESGDPYLAAVRIVNGTRRRWELMVYPTPDEVQVLEFPYELHFDALSATDDKPPSPYAHDETLKAACLAVVEQDVDGEEGLMTRRYQQALRKSYEADARSGPRKLGYFGNPGSIMPATIQTFRRHLYQRPEVTFNE